MICRMKWDICKHKANIKSINTIQLTSISYLLHLADNALILGHRNSEWCGHGPILEQDIAITNISLDLIGQARNFYQYAAALSGGDKTEDDYAYLRDAHEFKNLLLAEQPKGDWAYTTLRQFLFSAYQQFLFSHLSKQDDKQIAAIADKSLKEITYHLRWSSEWVIRLGDGTEESHRRMEGAMQAIWDFTGEIFIPADYEKEYPGLKALNEMKDQWFDKVKQVCSEATLLIPASSKTITGGKEGKHSLHLEGLLKEMQSVARAHPGAQW